MLDQNIPLGLKLNNPGNLRPGAEKWRGQVGTHAGFCQFGGSVWGLRALAVVLQTYRARKECPQTVHGIISRWAPNTENNTAAYIEDVAERVGVNPMAAVDVTNADTCQELVKAIIWHENGRQPYPPALVAEAVAMALGEAET